MLRSLSFILLRVVSCALYNAKLVVFITVLLCFIGKPCTKADIPSMFIIESIIKDVFIQRNHDKHNQSVTEKGFV